jgi:hypothetical protein
MVNGDVRMVRDTAAEAEGVLLELLRRAPAWRKLALVGQANAAVRLLAEQGLRQRHPQADGAEIRRRLAGLLLGEELATRAYGPLPSPMEIVARTSLSGHAAGKDARITGETGADG